MADKNEINLFGVIGSYFDGVTVEQVQEQLANVEDGPLVVNVSSPGGDAHAGLGIHSLLTDRGDVSFKIHGLAASAASFLTTAGPVEISQGGIYMLHDAWTVEGGNASDFRAAADRLDVHSDAIATLYAAKTGTDKAEIASMMEGETWLGAEDAMEAGFVDSIAGESADIAASIRIPKAFSYQHMPGAIAALVTDTPDEFYRQFFAKKPRKEIWIPPAEKDQAFHDKVKATLDKLGSAA